MQFARRERARGIRHVLVLIALGSEFCVAPVQAQQSDQPWRTEVRKYSDSHKWNDALGIVNEQIARSPTDLDIRAWRALVLTWAGRLPEAEQEFNEILKIEAGNPDYWIGLATVYLRQGRSNEALKTADHAVELDPSRADLKATRAQILRANTTSPEVRLKPQQTQVFGPHTLDGVPSGSSSIRGRRKEELRFGFDQDAFSFASANHEQWMSWVSKWTPRWTTNAAVTSYERGGDINAENFVGSITHTQPHWGAITIGGTTAHDHGVIPETGAFFELDHGFKISEDHPIRGIEIVYGQHWYWYTTGRILTANETTIVYLPRDWTLTIALTEARSHFTGTNIDWKPSGQTRLSVPLGRWSERELTGNMFFAVGTEDFAQVDQIGSFASRTYGGGLRFRFDALQDVTGYGAFQQRTQDRAQTSFGLSYGIRF
jgi:hypothetical protein